jgi:hypothetical protein
VSTPERRPSQAQAERMEHRLDELEHDIREAREHEQELSNTGLEQRYVDSGETPREDDQTIVPPG